MNRRQKFRIVWTFSELKLCFMFIYMNKANQNGVEYSYFLGEEVQNVNKVFVLITTFVASLNWHKHAWKGLYFFTKTFVFANIVWQNKHVKLSRSKTPGGRDNNTARRKQLWRQKQLWRPLGYFTIIFRKYPMIMRHPLTIKPRTAQASQWTLRHCIHYYIISGDNSVFSYKS